MPLDPGIILGYQPTTPLANPVQLYAGMLQLQQAEQQQREGAVKLRGLERAESDDAALRSAVRARTSNDGTIDWDEAIGDLQRGGHAPAALKLGDAITARRKEEAESLKVGLENATNALKIGGRIVRGILDEGTEDAFQRGKKYLSQVVGPGMADQLGPTYDPTRLKAALQWERDAGDSLTAQRDALNAVNQARDDARQAARDAPELVEKWTKAGSLAYSATRSQQDWDKVTGILRSQGMPTPLIHQFGAQWSPTAVAQAKDFGMTPKERADVEGDTAQRRISAGNLAVSQGQLNLARERLETEREDKAGMAADIATAIAKGEQPPTTTGLYGLGGRVRAELAKQNFNLTQATQDYKATERYLSSLNAPQQIRLRQAVKFADESLTLAEQLSQQWGSLGIPVLSRKNLDAAAEGTYGNAAQSLATRLKAQVADLQSELGTVYKGGNSSTDESLKLASENLKGEWSAKAFTDNIAQIRTNLRYRQNSLKTASVAGTSTGEMYGQPPAASGGSSVGSSGTVRMRDDAGVEFDIPADLVPRAEGRGLKRVK